MMSEFFGGFAATGERAPLAPLNLNAAAANCGLARQMYSRRFALPIQEERAPLRTRQRQGRKAAARASARCCHDGGIAGRFHIVSDSVGRVAGIWL